MAGLPPVLESPGQDRLSVWQFRSACGEEKTKGLNAPQWDAKHIGKDLTNHGHCNLCSSRACRPQIALRDDSCRDTASLSLAGGSLLVVPVF